MNNMVERILLIESDHAAEDLIREVLADERYGPFAIEWYLTLAAGLERLNQGTIKAVLLNLSLSDSHGIDTFDKLYEIACQVPILILSNVEREDHARQAIQRCAQDYFLKSRIEGYSLSHALRNVIARKKVEEELFLERERAQVTLNSIGDAVISADTVGNVTYLNLVAERMTGWSRKEAVGRSLPDVLNIIDGATGKPARNHIELAVERDKPVGLSANCTLIRRDGLELPIEDSAAPIHDRGGRVIGGVMGFSRCQQGAGNGVKDVSSSPARFSH